MYNVLIFPAGSEIGLEIFNALKFSKNINIYGGTSTKDHSAFVYKNLIENIPFVTEPDFIKELNKIITQYRIDVVYPAHDSIGMFLTEHLSEINAKVITSELKTVDICRSKSKTYEYFKEYSFVPKTYESAEEVMSYPVFVKPTVGQGSNGAVKVNSERELANRLLEGDQVVICEYLQGMEYTIDCFTDGDGCLKIVNMRDRARTKSGISVNSHRIPCPKEVKEIAEIINHRLKFNGAWFFQLKQNAEGKYKLLEISPRIPGTMGLSRNSGINFPLLSIYNAYGIKTAFIEHDYDIEVDRAFINRYKIEQEYDTIYLDLDDTIILKDKVNEWLMLYLYQSMNLGRKIILLTRHATEVYDTMKKYRISMDLFHEVIHLKNGELKSAYITEKNAIFIDDSFRERMDVREKCGIHVFDLDEVEALVDWRQIGL